jgi:hypothetical protein
MYVIAQTGSLTRHIVLSAMDGRFSDESGLTRESHPPSNLCVAAIPRNSVQSQPTIVASIVFDV